MRKPLQIFFILLLGGMFCYSLFEFENPDRSDDALNREFSANVIKIVDGDTLYVQDKNGLKHKLRLASIDAPEFNQKHGIASAKALRYLLDHKVEVKVLDVDDYDREVAIIFFREQDINLLQVSKGHAWVYTYYAKKLLSPQKFQQYNAAQIEAQNNKQGLWKYPNPIEPWVFRKMNNKALR